MSHFAVSSYKMQKDACKFLTTYCLVGPYIFLDEIGSVCFWRPLTSPFCFIFWHLYSFAHQRWKSKYHTTNGCVISCKAWLKYTQHFPLFFVFKIGIVWIYIYIYIFLFADMFLISFVAIVIDFFVICAINRNFCGGLPYQGFRKYTLL